MVSRAAMVAVTRVNMAVDRAAMAVTKVDMAVIKADMVGSRATESSSHMEEVNKANMAVRREAMGKGRSAVVRDTTMATMVGSEEEMLLREAGETLPQCVFVGILANVHKLWWRWWLWRE